MPRAERLLLPAFALANAVLYCSLVPLWEGFDEPFHYAYVQQLSVSGRLPVLGETRISEEVWRSMLLAPASHVVQRARPELQTFDRYFALSGDERRSQRAALDAIPRGASTPSSIGNYEAHQAPLAYALLALPDRLLSGWPITRRILWLRLIGALAGGVATMFGARRLFGALGVCGADPLVCGRPPGRPSAGAGPGGPAQTRGSAPHEAAALFCLIATQMYWATVGHVANDWLAIPLATWFFAELAGTNTPRLAIATALGLLAKAYFLPLAVCALAVVAWRRARTLPLFVAVVLAIAGPWYWRNLRLYGTLSATVESVAGVGLPQVWAAVPKVNWGRSILYMLRASLWTGNNSFTTFSAVTLNCMLLVLAAGLVLAIRKRTAAKTTVAGTAAVFGCAILYVTASDFVFRHGESAGASPWYLEVLLPPVLGLAFAGMSRAGRLGSALAAAAVLLWGYVSMAGYLVKLLPLYGGYQQGRMTLRQAFGWYSSDRGRMSDMLSTVSLAPPWLLYLETAVVCALAMAAMALLVRNLAVKR
jgi:hypothetical protein